MSLLIIGTVLASSGEFDDLIRLAREIVDKVVLANAGRIVLAGDNDVNIQAECDQLRKIMRTHQLETNGLEDDRVFYESFIRPLANS